MTVACETNPARVFLGTTLLIAFFWSDKIISSIESLISLKLKTVSAKSISSPVEINIAASNISRWARDTAIFPLETFVTLKFAPWNIVFSDAGIFEPISMIFSSLIENRPFEERNQRNEILFSNTSSSNGVYATAMPGDYFDRNSVT